MEDYHFDYEAYLVWEREGLGCLESLITDRRELGKTAQTIGLDLRDCWTEAVPILVEALRRGGCPNLLHVIYYLDGDEHGELIARCGEPSSAFPERELAIWCRPLGTTEHPEARAQLARLRRHRSRQVRIAATAHDRDYCTAARAIDLLDTHPDDAPIAHIAELEVRRDDVLADPGVQAAVVRLLGRRRDVLARALTQEWHELLSLVCGPSPALAEWLPTACQESDLHAAVAQILDHVQPLDHAMLQWIADHALADPARRARQLLATEGVVRGRFVDISGSNAELCPDSLVLDILEPGMRSSARVPATIEGALAKPERLCVSFDYADTTWVACLGLRGTDVYRPSYVWTEVAPLAEATAGALAAVANAYRARRSGDFERTHAPGALVTAIANSSGDRAIELNLRLHGAIDSLEPLVRPHVHARALDAARRQLFELLMTAKRYADALEVGGVIGPVPAAQALAAAGRYAEALAALDGISNVPEVATLARQYREQLARQKQASQLAVGVTVTHAKFGAGTVLSVVGEGPTQKAKVRFAGGERVLAASFLTTG